MREPTARIALGLILALNGCRDADDRDPSPAASPAVLEAGRVDSVDRLRAVLEIPDPYARARDLGALMPTLGDEALPYIQKTLDRFNAETGVVEFDLLLRHWANRRPEEAARWAMDKSPMLYRPTAIRTTLQILSRAEPAKAVPLVTDAYLQDTHRGAIAQFAVIDGWFQKDRSEALEYVRSQGSGIPRQRSLYAYAAVLAAADGPDAAIRWAESIPEDDPQFKQEVFQQMMSALVWVDPAAAYRFCETQCDGPYAKGLRSTLVSAQLQDGEPVDTMIEWVARTSATETEAQRNSRDKTLNIAFSHWALRDHKSALAWMEAKVAQPEPEPWLKVLYLAYARELAADDPARALAWAEKVEVEDEAARAITMIQIARYWRSRDEKAAEAWLSQSKLDDEQREQARNTKPPFYLPRTDTAQAAH